MNKRSIGYQIKSLDNLICRELFRETASCNVLTQAQGRIMSFIHNENKEGKEVYQRDIENISKLRRSTVSGVLQTMEKNNIIIRTASNIDKRIKKVVLTELGNVMVKKVDSKIYVFENMMSNGITKKELDIFYSVIDKIKNNLMEEKND